MTEANDLSDRELEILQLVATGASNKEIAQKLYISSNTVKVHLRNIFAKINVASRTEAAMFAVQYGYVETTQQTNDAGITVEDMGDERTPSKNKTRIQPLVLWSVLVIVTLLTFTVILVVTFNQSTQMASTNSPIPTELPRWEIKSPMPTARFGFATVAYENMIYAIAGENDNEVLGVVERYNPETDSWDIFTDKPTPVSDVKGAVIGGKIYIPGGRLASGDITTILEIYNPRDDIWELGTPLPLPVSAYALATYEGKLYLFGGWDGERYLDAVYEYDPALNLWISRTPMPTARGYAGAAVSGARIYIFGGEGGKGDLDLVEVYIPSYDDGTERPWILVSSMPDKRYAFGITSIADQIFIVGGRRDGESLLLSSLQFIPSEDRWKIFQNTIAQPLSHMGVTVLETHLYTIGGRANDNAMSQVLTYQAIYNIAIPLVR